MKSKFNKESRNLLIEMLLGDGTISSNNVFKIAHCSQQLDYLEWKVKQLKEAGDTIMLPNDITLLTGSDFK